MSGIDLNAALAAFFAARKPNTDAIANMALDNFDEMMSKTVRPAAPSSAFCRLGPGPKFSSRIFFVNPKDAIAVILKKKGNL